MFPTRELWLGSTQKTNHKLWERSLTSEKYFEHSQRISMNPKLQVISTVIPTLIKIIHIIKVYQGDIMANITIPHR